MRWIAVLGLIGGCGSGKSSGEGSDDTGVPGTTGTTGTTATTGTSGTTATTGATGDAPCADYSGVGLPVGTTWTFEVPADQTGYTGTWTTTVTANDGTDSTVETDGTYVYPSYGTQTTYGIYTYRCDATGALSVTGHYESSNEAGDITYTLDVTYDPPALIFPKDLEVGSAWDTEYVGNQTDTGGPEPFDYSVHYEITEETTLDLPAGTFTAVAIEQTSSLAPDYPTTQYFDRKAGFISAFFGDLVSFETP